MLNEVPKERSVRNAWLLQYLERKRAEVESSATVSSTNNASSPHSPEVTKQQREEGPAAAPLLTSMVEAELDRYLSLSEQGPSAGQKASVCLDTPAESIRRHKGVVPSSVLPPVKGRVPFAAALSESISVVQERNFLTAVDELTAQARRHEREAKALSRVIAFLRMVVQRRRFLEHTRRTLAEVAELTLRTNLRCAVILQRQVRGLLCRVRYRKLREEEALRAQEAQKKAAPALRRKMAGAGSTAAAAAGLVLNPQELALQRNMPLVQATRAYLVGRFDEAEMLLDAIIKGQSEVDAVVASLAASARRRREASVSGLGLAAVAAKPSPNAQSSGAPSAKRTKKK